MVRLNQQQKEFLIGLIKEGKDLPDDLKGVLFPTAQKEYELSYAGKMRKEDLLANEDGVFPVPLQIDKVFNGAEYPAQREDWRNLLVFGDNLQFLKTLYEDKDAVIKDKVKGKVKLIYIDPPFATEDDFKNKEGARAYSDKKKGAEFIEFLRRRLLVAKEILSEDGAIFVHLDQKKGHYIKIILDEIFGPQLFKNEIVWPRSSSGKTTSKNLSRDTDHIYWYTKSEKYTFNKIFKPLAESTIKMYNKDDCDGRSKYRLYPLQKTSSPGPETTYDYEDNNGKTWKCPKKGWRMKYEKLKALENDGRLYFGGGNLQEKAYWNERDNEGRESNNLWEDIYNLQGSNNEIVDYPTQKPERLLERIILMSTNKGDLVFDFFAGSGTLAETSEKLGRKWICCDIGKLSYFTMQKRILKIKESKSLDDSKRKYGKNAKSFMTCTLGLYDLKRALDLEWKKYLEFVSSLFEIDMKKTKISGVEFDGKRGEFLVKIWDYNKYTNSSVNEKYLNELHKSIGKRVQERVYIVAPANNIDFITDYHEIDGTKYYFLKIPYHVIKELHKIPFQKLRQPQSKNNVNDLDSAIGFHFIKQPEVKTTLKKNKNEIVLSIKEFESQYYKDEEGKVLNNFETLSAVFIDKDYNGNQFIMTDSFFASDLIPKKSSKKELETKGSEDIREELKKIKKEGVEIKINKSEVGNKIMVVYTDIYGNDFTEIFKIKK